MATMDVHLDGRMVQSVLIEHTIVFTLSGAHYIVIESPFRFERGTETMTLSPENDPEEMFQPIRELVGSTVEKAAVDVAGALDVRFSDGTRLEVEPDGAYEAWNVSGPDGALIVCTPGGALVIWTGTV